MAQPALPRAPQFPNLPPTLKPIQHFLKAATEYDQRDPPVGYWSRFYAVQTALKLDKSSKEALGVILPLMDWLEHAKKGLKGNEAVTNDVVAQAHVENAAWTVFSWADKQDRAAVFNKNVVKAFYTAGVLYDVLTTFGELTEENQQHRKYAKWKAAYIHNCLKNGETPVPGPPGGEDDEFAEFGAASGPGTNEPGPSSGFESQQPHQPPPPQHFQPPPPGSFASDGSSYGVVGGGGMDLLTGDVGMGFGQGQFQPSGQQAGFGQQTHFSPPQPGYGGQVAPASEATPAAGPTTQTPGGVTLSFDEMAKAQKYCKYASSALNYEDVGTAIVNLRKALTLLETGKDSG